MDTPLSSNMSYSFSTLHFDRPRWFIEEEGHKVPDREALLRAVPVMAIDIQNRHALGALGPQPLRCDRRIVTRLVF